jgi:hypothetical protein
MKRLLLTVVMALCLVSAARASFVALDADQVLDTSTSLVWLKNWNTIGPGPWQSNWASELTTGGVAAGSWASPNLEQYFDLWQNVGGSYSGMVSKFTNVMDLYWTNIFYIDPLNGYLQPYFFDARHGQLDTNRTVGPSANLYQTAVRSATYSDLNPVPLPAAAWLMLSGIGALGAAARQRKAAVGLTSEKLPLCHPSCPEISCASG